MNDLKLFLKACKDNPRDDAPRLILANYIEEQGDPERADFIRDQIANPSLRPEELPPKIEWFGGWWQYYRSMSLECVSLPKNALQFNRGLITMDDGIDNVSHRFLKQILADDFDWSWLEKITFCPWNDLDWSILFESPKLLEINTLRLIGDHYDPILIEPLTRSRYLSTLKNLYLSHFNVPIEQVIKLCTLEDLKGLQSLGLIQTLYDEREIEIFHRGRFWENLEHLEIDWDPERDSCMHALCLVDQRPKLKTLKIWTTNVEQSQLLDLAESRAFPNLESISLFYLFDDEEMRKSFQVSGLDAILSSSNFRLKELEVRVQFRSQVTQELPITLSA